MRFPDYFKSLSQAEREDFAQRAQLSPQYVTCHLISTPPRKMPRLPTLQRLAAASKGNVSMDEIIEHFTLEKLTA